MMRTPDGHGRVELTKYHCPALVAVDPAVAPPNTLGLRQVMFAVDDVDTTVERLRALGAALIGEVVQYGDQYRLAYVRGPAGIIVALCLGPVGKLDCQGMTFRGDTLWLSHEGRLVRIARPDSGAREERGHVDLVARRSTLQ